MPPMRPSFFISLFLEVIPWLPMATFSEAAELPEVKRCQACVSMKRLSSINGVGVGLTPCSMAAGSVDLSARSTCALALMQAAMTSDVNSG